MRNIARYLLAANLLNLSPATDPPPAPPAGDPPAPPTPPAPPAGDPPPTPPVVDPPVPPLPTPEDKAAKVTAMKTALKLPDGSTDTAALEKTAAIASELGLSPEHAQRLLDDRLQESTAARQSMLDSYAPGGSEWTKQNDAQKAAALADKDIAGGSQEKLTAFAAKAQKGMAALFGDQTAAVEEYLTQAGVASSPLLLKAFARVADKMGEAPFLTGTPPAGNAGKRPADIMYGTPAAQS